MSGCITKILGMTDSRIMIHSNNVIPDAVYKLRLPETSIYGHSWELPRPPFPHSDTNLAFNFKER